MNKFKIGQTVHLTREVEGVSRLFFSGEVVKVEYITASGKYAVGAEDGKFALVVETDLSEMPADLEQVENPATL